MKDDREYYSYKSFYLQRLIFMTRTMFLMMLMILLMSVVFSIMRLTPYFTSILEAKHEMMKAQAEGLKQIPDIESKIADLEKRTQTLTSENIETRLKKIETAIRVGEVKPENLSTLQDLRDDFEVLKSYMFSDPEQLVEFRTLQKDYQELKQSQDKIMPKEDILREIGNIRGLLYWLLGIFGILTTIFGGSWFTALRQARRVAAAPPGEPE